MPIVGDRLFNELDATHTACITGDLSAGKDRLAFDLALTYWREGFKIISNAPHNFGSELQRFGWEDAQDLHKSFCIFSEGGEYIRSQKLASDLTRSAGKDNYYAIFAGKKPPHKILQDMIIVPRFNFYLNYGIPAILWKVVINGFTKSKFTFFQVQMAQIHGIYSTRTSTAGIDNILTLARRTVDRLAKEEGHSAGVTQEQNASGFADDFASIGEDIESAFST